MKIKFKFLLTTRVLFSNPTNWQAVRLPVEIHHFYSVRETRNTLQETLAAVILTFSVQYGPKYQDTAFLQFWNSAKIVKHKWMTIYIPQININTSKNLSATAATKTLSWDRIAQFKALPNRSFWSAFTDRIRQISCS